MSREKRRNSIWINNGHVLTNFDAYLTGKDTFLVMSDCNWAKDEIADALSNIVEDKNNAVGIVNWTTFGLDL